ncbi:UPF0481 protein At3g47200-like [Tasmannia lanceolata]|uniref:UPF0481 protein At3g47200-like n=1 Tax=Tasmannia lanceolata TaxID=3420 RepID=UPI00406422E9
MGLLRSVPSRNSKVDGNGRTQLDDKWRRDRSRFLQLMILDGIFLLEILRKIHDLNYGHYAGNDPIFSRHGLLKNFNVIKEDMLMIENQVPLMVLATLVATEREVTVNDEVIRYINDLVFHFVGETKFSLQVDQSIELRSNRGLHLLELTWRLVSGERYERVFERDLRDFNMKPAPASYLSENAQVELKKSETNSLNGIRFENGVLILPILRIRSPTESVLLNLVAFEHLHAGASHEDCPPLRIQKRSLGLNLFALSYIMEALTRLVQQMKELKEENQFIKAQLT